MEGVGQASRLFSGLDMKTIVDETYSRCMSILDGKPVPGKHYDVIFDEENQVSLFGAFAMMFSGSGPV